MPWAIKEVQAIVFALGDVNAIAEITQRRN